MKKDNPFRGFLCGLPGFGEKKTGGKIGFSKNRFSKTSNTAKCELGN